MYKKQSAKSVYFIYTAVFSLALQIAFNLSGMYRINIVQLNPLQLVLVGTVLEGSIFLFEIPTGVVADVYSRRLSVIIGIFLIGIGIFVEGAFPVFGAVLLSQVLWGVGYTFTSGADDAWIADEIGEEGLEGVYLRASQIGQILSFAGIIISVQLSSFGLNVPILVGGGTFVLLAVFLIIAMKETAFKPASADDRETWRKMLDTFKKGVSTVKNSKTLLILISISAFYGLSSEGFDRLWDMHLIKGIGFPRIFALDGAAWFGIINGVSMLLSIGAAEIVNRSITEKGKEAAAWLLYVVNIIMVATVAAYALSGNFILAVSMLWANRVMNRINEPIYRAWTNRQLSSQVRATVLSMTGQVNALGQIIGGPIIGVIASRINVSFGILITAILLAPVVPLFAAMLRRNRI